MIQLLAAASDHRKERIRNPSSLLPMLGLFLFQEIIFDIIRSPITHAVDDRP